MDALPIWIQGTLLCLFGSTLTALGLVLQKQSHTAAKEEAHLLNLTADTASQGEESYWSRPWWLLGFLLFLCAQLINMVSMAMTPQSVLSCLGSWTLVCNTVFARLILGECMSQTQVVAICGLILTTGAIISTAPRPLHDTGTIQSLSIDFLVSRFTCWEFDCLTVVLFASTCVTWVLGSSGRLLGVPSSRTFLTDSEDDEVAFGSAMSVTASATAAAQLATKMAVPFSRAMAAAITSGYTALLFKCLSEIIASAGVAHLNSEDGSGPWCYWETYAIAAVAVSCAPAELHFLNLALQAGDAIFVVPVYLALGMSSQLLTGMVFFQEYRNFASEDGAYSVLHIAKFACSVCMALFFVVVMAKAQAEGVDVDSVTSCSPLEDPLLIHVEAEDEHSCKDWSPPPAVVVTGVDADQMPTTPSPAKLPATPRKTAGRQARGLTIDITVSVAGFGGAIECLDTVSNRARSRTVDATRLGSMSPFRARPIGRTVSVDSGVKLAESIPLAMDSPSRFTRSIK